jgi:hypothetical protein
VKHIKEKRLQDIGRIAPSVEVEGLEIGKGKAVLGVVKEKAVLAAVRPTVQALFEFESVRCSGSRMYMRSMPSHSLRSSLKSIR